MTPTLIFILHLTVCVDHKLTSKCETTEYRCTEEECRGLMRRIKWTAALRSPE